jgi:hypothetical protein
MIISRTIRLAENVAHVREKRIAYKALMKKRREDTGMIKEQMRD